MELRDGGNGVFVASGWCGWHSFCGCRRQSFLRAAAANWCPGMGIHHWRSHFALVCSYRWGRLPVLWQLGQGVLRSGSNRHDEVAVQCHKRHSFHTSNRSRWHGVLWLRRLTRVRVERKHRHAALERDDRWLGAVIACHGVHRHGVHRLAGHTGVCDFCRHRGCAMDLHDRRTSVVRIPAHRL